MQERVLKNPKIKVLWNRLPVEAIGNRLLQQVHLKNTTDDSVETVDMNGLFYAIGHSPNTSIMADSGLLDGDGYVITVPGSSRTAIEGVFAAGDVQDKRYRQAITAAGSGCMAALDCERWLEERGEQDVPE